MKIVINVPDYIKEQADDGKCEEFGIPLWLAYEIANGTPLTKKTGRWIEEDMFDGDVAYRCSECNELFWIESGTPKDNEYNFCPKCGAMLIDPQESEESDADSN